MIKVESGIPVPARTNRQGGRLPIYPFADLKVGESFFVPGKTVKTMSHTASKAAKRLEIKLITRTVEGGVRVWRTA